MSGLSFDEQIPINDARYMHYSGNQRRNILKDNTICRQYYNDIGEVTYKSFCLNNLSFCYCNHYMGQLAYNYASQNSCSTSAKSVIFLQSQHMSETLFNSAKCASNASRMNTTRIILELIHIRDLENRSEDLMQTNLLPELRRRGGYEKIITALDVFSRFALAYPFSNRTTANMAKVNLDIMTRHGFLQTLIMSDKGSVFISHVKHQVAKIIVINLKYAATNYAQTIGVLERSHATIKISLKMASGDFRKQWHKCLPIAIQNYNTAYHSSIDFKSSRVFHGRVSHYILDNNFGLRFNPIIEPTTHFASEVLCRNEMLYDKANKNFMQCYIKYKEYHDKKAEAFLLKGKDHCFMLHPKADHQR